MYYKAKYRVLLEHKILGLNLVEGVGVLRENLPKKIKFEVGVDRS